MTGGVSEPLDGIKVLDFSRLLPGPYCSLLLGDMGAEVVKIEPPGNGDYTRWLPPLIDGMGAAFIALNRGKKSVTLDLGTEVGRDAARRLARGFDVVLEGFRPGVMAAMGLDYETLSRDHPGLVYCSLTGYGQTGPYRARAGHDVNYQALAGILDAGRGQDGSVALPGAPVADLAGGALNGALAIVAALFQRTKSGKGQYLDIAMSDGALSMMMMPLAVHLAGGAECGPGKWLLSGKLPNYAIYQTKDGRALALGAIEPKFWLRFLERAGIPELADASLDVPGQDESLRRTIAQTMKSRARDAWMALLADEDVCCEPVLECDEVVHHPQHLARGMIQDVVAGDGVVQAVTTPLPFGPGRRRSAPGGDWPALDPAPALGADGEAVMRAQGFEPEEIDRLHREAGL